MYRTPLYKAPAPAEPAISDATVKASLTDWLASYRGGHSPEHKVMDGGCADMMFELLDEDLTVLRHRGPPRFDFEERMPRRVGS